MIRLEKSQAFGRIIRQGDPRELCIPTWTLVRDAVRAGKIDEALKFIDYGCSEDKLMHDDAVSVAGAALTYLASFGEEEIYKFLRKIRYPVVSRWLSSNPGVEECLQRGIEFQRGHGGNVTVTEESDRYVLTLDPCGSGGQLRRTEDVATTKKAYPWTWGKSGVPYYCVRCCVSLEIIPIELRGYPMRIAEVGDRPEDPCIHYYYKKPELVPEEYFTRLGMSKTIK